MHVEDFTWDDPDENRNGYFDFNEGTIFLAAIEQAAMTAQIVKKQPLQWASLIENIDSALTKAMVLALRLRDSSNTLMFGKNRRLLSLPRLYEQCCANLILDREGQKLLPPSDVTRGVIEQLQNLRNNFAHFEPMSYAVRKAPIIHVLSHATDLIERLVVTYPDTSEDTDIFPFRTIIGSHMHLSMAHPIGEGEGEEKGERASNRMQRIKKALEKIRGNEEVYLPEDKWEPVAKTSFEKTAFRSRAHDKRKGAHKRLEKIPAQIKKAVAQLREGARYGPSENTTSQLKNIADKFRGAAACALCEKTAHQLTEAATQLEEIAKQPKESDVFIQPTFFVCLEKIAEQPEEAAASAQFEGIASKKVLRHFQENLSTLLPDSNVIVGSYYPKWTELSPLPLLKFLQDKGCRLALPSYTQEDWLNQLTPSMQEHSLKGDCLIFREWTPEMKLEKDVSGIPAPPYTAPEVTPKILLVPLLAFDKRGYRLGRGRGYYDRYLANHKGIAVGLAFSAQEVEKLPIDKHDMRLDWVITEKEAKHFPK